MVCGCSSKVQPVNQLIKDSEKVVFVVLGKNQDKSLAVECEKSLRDICGQDNVKSYWSSSDAFDYIRNVDGNAKVILIIIGHSEKELKGVIPWTYEFSRKIRNLFVYNGEREHKEYPDTPQTQHVFGRRHLFSAIGDILRAISMPMIVKPLDKSVSMTIHENTFNELLDAMKSFEFSWTEFSITLSKMRIKLYSGSPIQFICYVTAKAVGYEILQSEIHGGCSLDLDDKKETLVLKIETLIVPFLCWNPDVACATSPIPFGGLATFGCSFDLLNGFEAKRLRVKADSFEYTVGEQCATLFAQLKIDEEAK